MRKCIAYLRETSTVGKLLYLYVIVLNLGLRVFGMTSNPALMQVTTRFTSSQVHFSGHIAWTPLKKKLKANSQMTMVLEEGSFMLKKMDLVIPAKGEKCPQLKQSCNIFPVFWLD